MPKQVIIKLSLASQKVLAGLVVAAPCGEQTACECLVPGLEGEASV